MSGRRRPGRRAAVAAPRAAPASRPPPAPHLADEAALREAALAHLARFSATEAGLLRVLQRRLARLARRALAAGAEPEAVAAAEAAAAAAARRVVADLVRIRAVDDASFAGSRARALLRSGRSERSIRARLAMHGVDPGLAGEATSAARAGAVLDDAAQAGARTGAAPADRAEALDTELAAALLHARRRHLGPFAREALSGGAPASAHETAGETAQATSPGTGDDGGAEAVDDDAHDAGDGEEGAASAGRRGGPPARPAARPPARPLGGRRRAGAPESAGARALASLARAGFSAAVAARALATDREAAEDLIERLRRL